jgi:hypothetical protein
VPVASLFSDSPAWSTSPAWSVEVGKFLRQANWSGRSPGTGRSPGKTTKCHVRRTWHAVNWSGRSPGKTTKCHVRRTWHAVNTVQTCVTSPVGFAAAGHPYRGRHATRRSYSPRHAEVVSRRVEDGARQADPDKNCHSAAGSVAATGKHRRRAPAHCFANADAYAWTPHASSTLRCFGCGEGRSRLTRSRYGLRSECPNGRLLLEERSSGLSLPLRRRTLSQGSRAEHLPTLSLLRGGRSFPWEAQREPRPGLSERR